MDEFEIELKQGFIEEATQLLQDAEQAFLGLESRGDDPDLLDQIFRLAHNLKGASRAVGFGEIAEFTHVLENLILKLKEGEIQVTAGVVTLLLECNDHVTHMVDVLRDDFAATFDSVALVERLNGALNGELSDEGGAAEPEASAEPVDEAPQESAFAEGDEAPSMDASVDVDDHVTESQPEAADSEEAESSGGFEDDDDISLDAVHLLEAEKEADQKQLESDVAPAPVAEAAPAVEPATPAAAPAAASASNGAGKSAPPPAASSGGGGGAKKPSVAAKPEESIRVSLNRLENLNNFVGELVILQSMLNQHKEEVENPMIVKSLGQLEKLSKEIHEISMSLRMIPVKTTLQKMQRIVRDTSKLLGKDVELILRGEETEVDKTVLEKLGDPLVHIVRNAVDHGLEDPEGRLAANKSTKGRVTIACMHEGNNLVIEIKDDGKGIDKDRIFQKAVEKKIVKPDSNMSEHDILQLIFHPGFSTKDQVSEVSGRGVGMDVVKTNIQALSGAVTVSTKMGQGSVFRISLPLTMAVIDGMIIRIGKEKYVFPLSQVNETLKPEPENVKFVTSMGENLNLRGETLPIFRLSHLLNSPLEDRPADEMTAVIVRAAKQNYAVLVDEILHQQQVVIKKLGQEIKQQKGFMGSSILGDGLPSLIIDLYTIIEGTTSTRKRPNIKPKAKETSNLDVQKEAA